MKRNLSSMLLIAGLAAGADFSYVERTEMTGGALKKMMGFMGRFAKGVNEPISSTHTYSGNKKATVASKSHEIWDLNAETITSINAESKEYSVITFAEMAQLTMAMAEQMSQAVQKKPETPVDATAKWKASFDKNGQTRQVAGVTANGGTMKMELEASNTKTGQSGVMKMDIDMWMGKLPGWEVKQAFDKKVGEKFASHAAAGPQLQAMAQAGPAAMEAMKEAGKKISELGEMTLASVTKMYSDSIPNMPDGAPGSKQSSGPSAGQVVKEEATREAEYEAARRVGGRLGGLGGRLGGRLGQMGRNKPKEESQSKPAEPSASSAPATPAGPGVLMEMTTEVISYSSSADNSAFQIPAGFKQVEHPMKKAWAKHANK